MKDTLAKATDTNIEELEKQFKECMEMSSQFLSGAANNPSDAVRLKKHSDLQDFFDAQKEKIEQAAEKKRRLEKLKSDSVAKEQDIFNKYDSTKTGKLFEKDIIAFAKGEYGFDLTAADAKKIFKQVSAGKGITVQKMKMCRSRVGAVHSTQRHKAKQAVELDEKMGDYDKLDMALDDIQPRLEGIVFFTFYTKTFVP